MKPEDIRKLYHQVTPATEAEHAKTRAEALRNPDMARAMIRTVYSMAAEGPTFERLLRHFIDLTMMQLIEERAAGDDAFALRCARDITDLMDRMAPPPRGKPKPARSA